MVEKGKGVFSLFDVSLTSCLPGIQVNRERASPPPPPPPPVFVSENSLIDGGVETTAADLSSASVQERISVES